MTGSIVLAPLTRIGLFGGSLAIVTMACHIFLDIIGKSFFAYPLTGTLELVTYYYMVACTFLALPFVQQQQANITADLIAPLLGRRLRRICDTAAAAITTLFFLVAGAASLVVAWERSLRGETVDATLFELWLWPSRWMPVYGFLLAAVFAARQAAALRRPEP